MELGIKVKDRISGFSGVVTGFVTYLTGCNQALVAPAIGKDGNLRHAEWFDVQRLERIGTSKITLDNSKSPGFDRAPPVR